jgi:membrane peptidoglycan carboxypeptidase
VIEWGRGVFGVDAAARTYFGKSASALTLEESTRLAAVIPSPLRHRPSDDSRYVLRRKQIVLNRMLARNMGGVESLEGEEDQMNGDEEPAVTPGTEEGHGLTGTDSGGVNGF